MYIQCNYKVLIMAIIQIRVDDELKEKAVEVFEKNGLDLSTAIRIFLKKSVNTDGIPFSVIAKPMGPGFEEAVKKMNNRSVELGNDKMTLDEINEEISLARRERKNKLGK